jgi:fumarate reductase flavoprotein subunit
MLETPGMELIIKAGAVVGVVAENEDGRFNVYAEHGVIIATGGFADNPEMIKKYVGLENVSVVVGLKRTGDGINMAMAAGAITEGMGLMHNLAVKKVAPDGSAIAEIPLSMLANQPRNVWVNSNGERFCDEWVAFDFASGSGTIRRENAAWSIFDENLRDYYMTKGTDAGIGVIGEAMTKMTNFDEIWNNAVKANDPYVVKGSLKDIATKAGIPFETLRQTMNDYNANAAKNIDPDFAKDRRWLHQFDLTKPLYAIRMQEIAMTTLGGIRVNKYLQALDKDLKPIPGLYVAGNDVGGLSIGSYSLYVTSGMTFGFAVNSGRMAATDILVKTGKAKY